MTEILTPERLKHLPDMASELLGMYRALRETYHDRQSLDTLQVLTDLTEALRNVAASHEALRARLAEVERERDEARKNYQFMVDKAASNNLQHYREMGAETLAQIERAEAAERERDEWKEHFEAAEAERDRYREALEKLVALILVTR